MPWTRGKDLEGGWPLVFQDHTYFSQIGPGGKDSLTAWSALPSFFTERGESSWPIWLWLEQAKGQIVVWLSSQTSVFRIQKYDSPIFTTTSAVMPVFSLTYWHSPHERCQISLYNKEWWWWWWWHVAFGQHIGFFLTLALKCHMNRFCAAVNCSVI